MPKVSIFESYQEYCEELEPTTYVTKNIRISTQLHTHLNNYCKSEGINKSSILRQVMSNYLVACQKNSDYYPLGTYEHLVVYSNFDLNLREPHHIERRVYAFRVPNALYDDFVKQCHASKRKISYVLEAMIAALLIREKRLSVVKTTIYGRLSDELHTEYVERCKKLGVKKSELMEYFFTYYIEHSQSDRTFSPLDSKDFALIQKNYGPDLGKPSKVSRIICVFRLYKGLYDEFSEQCVKNHRRICDVIEEMMASFLLETENII